jgi:Transglycosylase SLT domain
VNPEIRLMEHIRHSWGVAIATACHVSSVPEDFLAALVANESGGDPTKSRFEEKVFSEILSVCAGKRSHYGSLGAEVLIATPQQGPLEFKPTLKRMVDLATSWGLTQIMGYQVLSFARKLETLSDPQENLTFATVLLAQFANRHQLDLRNEHAELFACWNTGEPDPAKTYDPNYCVRGIARMNLYSELVLTEGAAKGDA